MNLNEEITTGKGNLGQAAGEEKIAQVSLLKPSKPSVERGQRLISQTRRLEAALIAVYPLS